MNIIEAARVREEFNTRYPGINDLIHQTFMHDAKTRGEEVVAQIDEDALLTLTSADPGFAVFLQAHEMSTCKGASGVRIVFDPQNRTLTFVPPPKVDLIPVS